MVPADGSMIFIGAGTAGLNDDAAAVAAVFRRHASRDDRGFAYDETREIDAGARVAALDNIGAVNEDRIDAGPSAADADAGAGGDVAGEGSGVFCGDTARLKRVSVNTGNEQCGLKRAPLWIRQVFYYDVVDGGDDVGAVLVEQRTVRGDSDSDGLLSNLQYRRDADSLASAEGDTGGDGGLKALAGDSGWRRGLSHR